MGEQLLPAASVSEHRDGSLGLAETAFQRHAAAGDSCRMGGAVQAHSPLCVLSKPRGVRPPARRGMVTGRRLAMGWADSDTE